MRPTDVEELGEGDPGEVALENALRKARAARRLGAAAERADAGAGSIGAMAERAGAGSIGAAAERTGVDVEARAGARVGSAAGGAAELVLGCDTLVALDGAIYGKPRDESHARATLRALSGATHEVLSGLALLGGGEAPEGIVAERTAVVRTAVTFRELDEGMLDWYLALGEWRGRAGGYAIQGAGAALVRRVEGDYENVVGLPLAALLDVYPSLIAEQASSRVQL